MGSWVSSVHIIYSEIHVVFMIISSIINTDPIIAILNIFFLIDLRYSAGYLKDTQMEEGIEKESKMHEDEDVTQKYNPDTSINGSSHTGQRTTIVTDDGDGHNDGTARIDDNDDSDAVSEEFLSYINEK
jgi:hypothetical protein